MKKREMLPFNNLVALVVLFLIASSLISSYLTYINYRDAAQEVTGRVPAKILDAHARVCVNKPPVLSVGCAGTAYVNYSYTCNVGGTDPENETLTFLDNTTLFNIDGSTGQILFTPNESDTGNYSILLTLQDDSGCINSNGTQIFNLTVLNETPPAPPSPGPTPTGGGGGGGGAAPTVECTPQWECTPWSSCSPSGMQNRKCYLLNRCDRDKPNEEQMCIYLLPPAPRPPGREFYFCNFDIVDECTELFGLNEDWIYTYKGRSGVLNILSLSENGADIALNDDVRFWSPMTRIRAVDEDLDGINDFEFIAHRLVDGRIEVTARLIRTVEVIVERPRYVEMLPWFVAETIYFTDINACFIIIGMILVASILIWLLLVSVVEKNRKID